MPCKEQQNQSRRSCNNIKENRTRRAMNGTGAKRCFTLIKYNIYRKDITAMNSYAPDNIAPIHKVKTKRYTRKK